jgi:hypothetical protein
VTPEFSPDSYLQQIPFSEEPVADLRQINGWLRNCERDHFAVFMKERGA